MTIEKLTRRHHAVPAVLFGIGLVVQLATAGGQDPAAPTGAAQGAAHVSPGNVPGRLVDVGGFDLHILCEGAGSPTVVVEAGLGDTISSWGPVQSAVAARTRICLYDRAGSGWSGDDSEAPTPERVAENLRTLLDNGGITGPYVLVGHSLGGIFARRFAADHPADTAALLLVDSAHEDQIRSVPEALTGTASDLERQRFCGIEAPMGVVRAAGLVNAYVPVRTPENLRPMHPEAIERTRYCETVRREAGILRRMAQAATVPSPLGDMPLIVLTAGHGALSGSFALGEFPTAAVVEWNARWLELQEELAGLSTRSQHRVIDSAGHYIQIDQPDAVVDAIEQALASVPDLTTR